MPAELMLPIVGKTALDSIECWYGLSHLAHLLRYLAEQHHSCSASICACACCLCFVQVL
jgi:hypothetical protein